MIDELTRTTRPLDPAAWWRRTCWIPGTRIALSGDLPTNPTARHMHLERWVADGIDHIIDVRIEHSDELAVAALQPQVQYHWLGVDDDGGDQPDEWFAAGVDAALEAMGDPTSHVMVHCHMGVNRGPSMGLAILLAMGWEPLEALDSIRRVRPIAGLLYAEQALDWWQRTNLIPNHSAAEELTRVRQWLADNTADTDWIISRIWQSGAA